VAPCGVLSQVQAVGLAVRPEYRPGTRLTPDVQARRTPALRGQEQRTKMRWL
jgi:hypothetical protein